ncbi:cytochrome P450 2H2 isoform X2 [Excalfactoria chinensis]|uniref:cytochrome P450 2H2 isoform X2 n=1 Tax=Excalfactoria chinensis TaxID=46218 RepID=UPI003B3BB501
MEFLGWPTILLLVCISCLLIAAWRSTSQRGKEPPGPTPIPIIGNAFQLNPRDLMQSFKEISKKYGPIFTIHLGPQKAVVLYGYDIVKEALIDNGEVFSGRGNLPLFDKVFKGMGIVTSNGESWRQLRRFALTTLRDFGMGKRGIEEQIQEEARFLVERIRNTHEKPFNPTTFLMHAVSNIICSVVFGDRFEYEDKKFLDLIEILDENEKHQNRIQTQLYNFFPTILDYLPGPHKKLIKSVDKVDAFITEIIRAHQESFDPSCPRDFMDAFINKMQQEKGNSYFTVESLIRTALDLFLAGTGTTSTTLRYGFLILLKHPEVEEKIHKEIDRVVGRDRSPCMADRSQLPYTDAVIHEIQRFIDFIPVNLPHAVTKDTMFRGYFIPKDTMIFPLLSPILQDCKEFPNPEKFDPGHFLNANGTFRKSNYFMPFSAGKRVCAGEGLARMEIFLFLTSILQNFTLKPVVARKDIDISPIVTSISNIPRPYEVSFIPR